MLDNSLTVSSSSNSTLTGTTTSDLTNTTDILAATSETENVSITVDNPSTDASDTCETTVSLSVMKASEAASGTIEPSFAETIEETTLTSEAALSNAMLSHLLLKPMMAQ